MNTEVFAIMYYVKAFKTHIKLYNSVVHSNLDETGK